MTAPVVKVERLGAATLIELHRPDVLNAWDAQLTGELHEAIHSAASDPAVRAVLLTGAGRAFSAGADVKSDLMNAGPEPVLRSLREQTNPIILAVRTMPKPVVAAVNGVAAGVGCSLALACDLVVAAESASFVLAFARVGLTLDGGASLLVAARAGHARAARMALLAERVAARDALAWGLVDEVVADADHAARTRALAERLAAGPTLAHAATKRSLNAALYPRLAEQLELEAQAQAELLAGADYAEGVAAFAAGRPPSFSGA